MATTCDLEAGSPSDERSVGSLRRTAIRGGSVYIGCKWAAQLLAWVTTLGVARLLSPDDYGVMAGAMMLLGLGDLLAEAGVGRALVQKQAVTSADYDQAFTVSLLLSLGCYGLLLASAGAAARFLKIPPLEAVLPVIGIVILIMPFRTISLGILDRRLELKRQGAAHIIMTALQAGAVLGLAISGARYWSLVVGALIARVIETLFLYSWAGWRPRVVLPGEGARKLLRFGIPISLSGLLWFFYSNSDYVVVGRLAGPAALGYYSLAYQLMLMPVQKVTGNVNQIAFPIFCRLQGDRERMGQWFLRLTTLLLFLIVPILGGAALVARDGIGLLLGEKWVPAALPFQILSGVGLPTAVTAALMPLLNALGRPDISFKYTAACALVFPACFTVAGLSYGVIGVCLVWVTVFPIIAGLLVHLTREITGVGLWTLIRAQLPVLRACAAMAVAVVGAQAVVGGSAPAAVRLAAAIGIGAITYAGCLWLPARQTALGDLGVIWKEIRGRRSSAAEA